MLGQGWYRDFPEKIYRLKYFRFKSPFGGLANDGPELELSVKMQQWELFVERMHEHIALRPFGNCHLAWSEEGATISISNYYLYDYDFLFALEIEKLLEQFDFQRLQSRHFGGDRQWKMLRGTGKSKFHETQITSEYLAYRNWEVGDSRFGSVNLALQVTMVHRRPQLTSSLLAQLKNLALACDFQILWVQHQHYLHQDFLQVFATNGRQGLQFAPYHTSDIAQYQDGLAALFTKFDLIHKIPTTSYEEFQRLNPPDNLPWETIKLIGDIDNLFWFEG